MTSPMLETVVEQVKALTREEQQELRTLLDEIMETAEYERKRWVFFQRLIDKGMLSEMPGPRKTAEEFEAFKAVEVEGEPMSATVIKERR